MVDVDAYVKTFGRCNSSANEQRLREAIKQARHEWQATVIEAAATECDKRADELREGAHAHYIDPYTEQRETAYLEAKLLAERLRCRLTTADIAAARERMIAEGATAMYELMLKKDNSIYFDTPEDWWNAVLRLKAGKRPADDSQLARQEAADLQTAAALAKVESILDWQIEVHDGDEMGLQAYMTDLRNIVSKLPRNQAILERYEAQVRLSEHIKLCPHCLPEHAGGLCDYGLRLKAGEV